MASVAVGGLRILLEAITIALLVALAVIVVLAVAFRFAGASFVWYDEVASVMLAWITYFGAALAALKRRHLGFSGFVLSLSPGIRGLLFVVAELVIYATFLTAAWASWFVLRVMAGETLQSLAWVPLQFTQSVVPVGCALFLIAHALSTPIAWARLMAGRSAEDVEIAEELAKAETARADQGRGRPR